MWTRAGRFRAAAARWAAITETLVACVFMSVCFVCFLFAAWGVWGVWGVCKLAVLQCSGRKKKVSRISHGAVSMNTACWGGFESKRCITPFTQAFAVSFVRTHMTPFVSRVCRGSRALLQNQPINIPPHVLHQPPYTCWSLPLPPLRLLGKRLFNNLTAKTCKT